MNSEYNPKPPELLWWAVDEDGNAYYYVTKPTKTSTNWCNTSGDWFYDADYNDLIHNLSEDWKNSLKYLGDIVDATE